MASSASRSFSPPEAARALRGAVACRLATGERELEAHMALRWQVFAEEQGIFAGDDADGRDEAPETLHAIGLVGERICGTVRLYPLDRDGRRWKGDRLAVARECRSSHVGAELVRFAVRTSGELGGSEMVAHIQLANVRFFERLGWSTVGSPALFHGVEHQLMRIGLSARRGP